MRYEIPSIGTTFDRSEAVPQEGPVNLRILCESSHGILVEVMGATKTVLPWQYYDIVANKEPVKITPIDGYDSAIRTYKVTRIIYPSSIDYLTDESDILCSTVGLEDIENLNEKIDLTKTDLETEINTVDTNLSNKIDGVKSELQANLQQVNTSLSSEINQTKADLETAENNIEVNKNTIDILQIDKANRGYLQLNKAKLTTATNNATTLPLTLCATVECDDWSGLKNISGAWNGGREFTFLNSLRVQYSPERFCGFNFGIGSQTGNVWTELLLLLGDNDAGGTYASNIAAYNIPDSKKITICASISEIENFAVKFYVGGALLKTTANKPSTLASNTIGGASVIATGNYGYATSVPQSKVSNVKVSRLKIFNCVLPAIKADDINGIGYTIEDYNNGVDEPPSLKGGRRVQITSGATITDTGISFVPSAGTNISFKQVFLGIDKPIPAGAKIRVKVDGYKVKDVPSASLIEFRYGTGSSAYSRVDITGGSGYLEFTTDRDASLLMPMFNFASTSFDGTTDTIAVDTFEVWVNGVLLSLSDYTVTNGSTQQVLDVSDNANDATVALSTGGSLKGSNDIGVGRLIDFIKGQSA